NHLLAIGSAVQPGAVDRRVQLDPRAHRHTARAATVPIGLARRGTERRATLGRREVQRVVDRAALDLTVEDEAGARLHLRAGADALGLGVGAATARGRPHATARSVPLAGFLAGAPDRLHRAVVLVVDDNPFVTGRRHLARRVVRDVDAVLAHRAAPVLAEL